MDDVKLYGDEMYHIGFVKLLRRVAFRLQSPDITVNGNDMPVAVQEMVSNNPTGSANDVNKLIGCVNVAGNATHPGRAAIPNPCTQLLSPEYQNFETDYSHFQPNGRIYYKNLATKPAPNGDDRK